MSMPISVGQGVRSVSRLGSGMDGRSGVSLWTPVPCNARASVRSNGWAVSGASSGCRAPLSRSSLRSACLARVSRVARPCPLAHREPLNGSLAIGAALVMPRLIGRGVRGLLVAVGCLAAFIGLPTVFAIVFWGMGAVLKDFDQPTRPSGVWIGLLFIGCAVYLVVWIMREVIKAQGKRTRRYADLYAAALRLKEAGQKWQDSTARGSRGEAISAELHWLDAVADVDALRPPTPPSEPA